MVALNARSVEHIQQLHQLALNLGELMKAPTDTARSTVRASTAPTSEIRTAISWRLCITQTQAKPAEREVKAGFAHGETRRVAEHRAGLVPPVSPSALTGHSRRAHEKGILFQPVAVQQRSFLTQPSVNIPDVNAARIASISPACVAFNAASILQVKSTKPTPLAVTRLPSRTEGTLR